LQIQQLDLSAHEARDWELFVDWCVSFGQSALSTDPGHLGNFIDAFPAPIETQKRRTRAIRKALRLHQIPQLSTDTQGDAAVQNSRALRVGPAWASVSRALAEVPKYHHPKHFDVAVRGRRDGWLLVLIGVLRFTRNEARELSQSNIQLFPHLAIAGRSVPKIEPIAQCPACAVTRWLRITGAASFGFVNEVRETLDPNTLTNKGSTLLNAPVHDCIVELDELWRQANTLLPAVDQHGWVSSAPMSIRSVSAAMANRQGLDAITERRVMPRPDREQISRFANATMNELAQAYDDVDQMATIALSRLNSITNDGDAMLDYLSAAGL